MTKTKAVVHFGSREFVVYVDSKEVFRQPSAIIMKKSLHPSIIYSGYDAITHNADITEDEMFVRPIKNGAVAHVEGARLFIKECLNKAFNDYDIEVCALINCGLDIEQKKIFERAFVTSGYANVFLAENILTAGAVANRNGIEVVTYIGGDTCEAGIVREGKIISAYTLDIGIDTAIANMQKSIKEKYGVILAYNEAQRLFLELATLHNNDLSVANATGIDILSGKAKRIILGSKEVYEAVFYVIKRFSKMLDGLLYTAPNSVLDHVSTAGILLCGEGALLNGVGECINRLTMLNTLLEENAHFVGGCDMLSDGTFELE